MAEESEDEDKEDPEERISLRAADKRVAKDEEFSDSEDEGDDRRDVRSHKKKEGGVPTPPKRPKVTSEQGDEAAGEKTPSDTADASSTAAGGKICVAVFVECRIARLV